MRTLKHHFFQLSMAMLTAALIVGCTRPVSVDPAETAAVEKLLSQISEAESSPETSKREPENELPESPASANSETETRIRMFCGDCHAFPDPASYEQQDWPEKALKGFEYYARSQRTDLEPPTLDSVIAYFKAKAPAQIEFPKPTPVDQGWARQFVQTKLDWSDLSYVAPAVATIQWLDTPQDNADDILSGPLMLVSDMRDGSVSLIRPARNSSQSVRKVAARMGSPARMTVVDANQDGRRDLIVAELGSLNPFDHGFGKLVLLEQEDGGTFRKRNLLEKTGRIADIAVIREPQDDGELDLVVAEFGHRGSGAIRSLQVSMKAEEPVIESRFIDNRPGTVRLLPRDWNEDGSVDFLALVTQEYESIELFQGLDKPLGSKIEYSRKLIRSGNLSDGSVGLTETDLDGDGNLDLLYVAGDCFDDNYAQLSHNLTWLENLGEGRFEEHVLYHLPGAYQAKAADFDQDSDQDIVLVANLPTNPKPASLSSQQSKTAIVVLEQTSPSQFEPHVLQAGSPRYSALECGDFDADGKIDFAVGTQLLETDPPTSAAAKQPRLTVWWNCFSQ